MDLTNTILKTEVNLNKLITNLENIASLKESDKLSIDNELLVIDEVSFFQSFYRKYNNDSRTTTIEHIEKIIKEIFEYIDNLNSEQNIFKEKTISDYNKINQYLIRTIPGLQNLKITYFNDIKITNRIDLIIIKIENRINKINQLLK
jgi:hypothetical protein